jgi:hypothetical protein
MIGVTRKQRWHRRSDGALRTAQYRYYQCESRTNRSLCDYHTRRAEELEDEVRKSLRPRGRARAALNGTHASDDTDAEVRRIRERARRLDKRLEDCLDSALSGRLSSDKLRVAAFTIAGEQLQLEQRLQESQRLAEARASEAERRREREQVLRRLREEWDTLAFGERKDLIRGVLDRIVVKDDGIETVLKP